VILITFAIYIRAGREIYKKHKQLREFSFSTSHHDPEPLHGVDDLFSSTKTTEVFVTTEVIDKPDTIDLAPLGGGGERSRSQDLAPQKPAKAAYSVTISSNRHHGDNNNNNNADGHVQTTITANPHATAAPGTAGLTRSTTNTTNPNKLNTLTSTTGTGTGTGNANPLRRRAAYEANNATWSYTKCAILFFTAMLVTWIPSSANRVYSVVHPGEASLALEYMSAFVLPLQGFWNAIIYCVTSWGACKMLWEDVRSWWSCVGTGSRSRGRGLDQPHELTSTGGGGGVGVGGGGGGGGGVGLHLNRSPFQMMGNSRNGSKGSDSKTYETESMTELAGSRPGSSGAVTVAGRATPPPPEETVGKMGV
jgi:hypothetical protein